MAFEQSADRDTLQGIWVVLIRGLKYFFSSQTCPPAWNTGTTEAPTVSYGGETYIWSSTVVSDSGFAATKHAVQPRAGFGRASGLNLEFQMKGTDVDNTSGVWLDIGNKSVTRSDRNYCTITADLNYTGATLNVNTTNGFPSSGTIYLGKETMSYSGKTSTSFTGLARGLFSSLAEYHVGSPDSASEMGGGGTVSDGSLTLEGRFIEAWLIAGRDLQGVFVPNGSAPCSSEDWNTFRGTIHKASPNSAQTMMDVSADSIGNLLSRNIMTRAPLALSGQGGFSSWEFLQVDDSNNRLSWSFVRLSSGYHTGGTDVQLIRNDGTGSNEVVPDGRYHRGLLASYIAWTLNNGGSTPGTQVFCGLEDSTQVTGSASTEDKPKYQLRVIASLPGTEADWRFYIEFTSDNMLWGEIGFDAPVAVNYDKSVDPDSFILIAQRNACAFRWPLNNRARRLYTHNHTGPSFVATTGIVDDDGTSVAGGYARIGDKEIVRFDSVEEENTVSAGDIAYLNVTHRNQFGTRLLEEIYVPWEPDGKDLLEVKQGLAFPGVSVLRMFLYCAIGIDGSTHANATYNPAGLWRGTGAKIPPGFINISSIEALSAKRTSQQKRNGWIFFDPISLRDAFKHEMISEQMFLHPLGGTSGVLLSAGEVTPPNADDDATAREVSHNTVLTRDDISISEGDLINTVVVKCDYNAATGKFRQVLTYHQLTSQANWGERDPLTIEVKGLLHVPNAAVSDTMGRYVRRMVQSIWGAYSWPYKIITFNIGHPMSCWVWQLGDAVKISHEFIPAVESIGRGVTDMLGRMYAKADQFMKENSRAQITTVVRGAEGRKYGTWAPGAQLTTRNSSTNFTVAANAYSFDGFDLDDFDAGDAVRFYYLGSESSAETDVIVSASSTTLVLTTGITLDPASAPANSALVMEPCDHDDPNTQDSQKKHVYMSDGFGSLDNDPSGTNPEYRYK